MILNVDIYNRTNWLKIAFLIGGVIVIAFSLYYTDRIVSRIEEREKQQIQLYAEALKDNLMMEMDQSTGSLVSQIIQSNANNSVPAIHKSHGGALISRNIEIPPGLNAKEEQAFLQKELSDMISGDHGTIVFDNGLGQNDYIYYGDSKLLNQLRYYPLVQLLVVVIFFLAAYLWLSSSRKAEQNRVWVGLAKETAHQLGTPLSSLTAWVEYFKTDPRFDEEIVREIEKDVQRLDTITTRFSNIGSVPVLKDENIFETVEVFMNYLQKRISSKVHISIQNNLSDGHQTVRINKYLFEWVIENICKNAVDAMGGIGSLTITMKESRNKQIALDFSDTGKGISKKNLSKVFNAGFSTKKRGWGLGLTLAKRIVENYHNGKLYVKSSEIGKGTIFRILLPYEPNMANAGNHLSEDTASQVSNVQS